MAIMCLSRCLLIFTWVCSLAAAGCGYGVNSSTPSIVTFGAPVILQQPSNQSVPMGLAATYSVSASGDFMQYQWTRNGVNLSAATGNTYVTPPTTFADSGASFAVSVTNTAGAVTSSAVTLTVTARAPAKGDLRFQQVDAASTVNGYGSGGSGSDGQLTGGRADDFMLSVGTSFWVGGMRNCTTGTAPNEPNCTWRFATVPLPASQTALGLASGYASDAFSNLQYDLADPHWPNIGGGASPAAAGAVATSLDLEPAAQLFAVSWIQVSPDTQSTFSVTQNTVSPGDLQTAASQEGLNSRVITAISNQNGAITYLSYGWSGDPTTLYDLTVSTASPAAAPATAAALAAQGYIITATGLADSSGDVVFVGARVQGDAMARPFMTAQGAEVATMMQQGYATVGIIVDPSQAGFDTYLGER